MTGIFTSILEWIVGWVGNYGWSVVVFTLMVRLVLMPLDIKSKKSMRAMSKVQPKVQAIQKKYAGDKEKLNLKLNELYRKEHVSPMSGCLPMLISLPILWFMFAAMRNLANEHTISMILQMKDAAAAGDTAEAIAAAVRDNMQSWLWIKNVFQPDSFMATILPKVGDGLKTIAASSGSTVLTADNLAAAREFLTTDIYREIAAQFGTGNFVSIPLNLLIINPSLTLPTSFEALFSSANGLFILPVLAALSQFFMTKFTSNAPKQTAEADDQQSNPMNNGFMKWFFPLFSLYICAGYNAAFAIYWMAANVIQVVQQLAVNWYFDRQDQKKALGEAAKETIE